MTTTIALVQQISNKTLHIWKKPNSLQHGLHIKVNVKTARPLKTDFEVKQMTHRVCLRLNKIFKEEYKVQWYWLKSTQLMVLLLLIIIIVTILFFLLGISLHVYV